MRVLQPPLDHNDNAVNDIRTTSSCSIGSISENSNSRALVFETKRDVNKGSAFFWFAEVVHAEREASEPKEAAPRGREQEAANRLAFRVQIFGTRTRASTYVFIKARHA